MTHQEDIPEGGDVECFFEEYIYPLKSRPVVAKFIVIKIRVAAFGILVCHLAYFALAALVNRYSEVLVYAHAYS